MKEMAAAARVHTKVSVDLSAWIFNIRGEGSSLMTAVESFLAALSI